MDAWSVATAQRSTTRTPPRVVMRRADGKPIHVLVVDDEPVLAELVSMALRYEGWEIATAGDGATAIALARQTPPDVVVLHVMLPDTSGLAPSGHASWAEPPAKPARDLLLHRPTKALSPNDFTDHNAIISTASTPV